MGLGPFQPQVRPFETVATNAIAAVVNVQPDLLAALDGDGKIDGLFRLFLPEHFLPEGLEALDFFHVLRRNQVQGDLSGAFRLVHQQARMHVQAAGILELVGPVRNIQAQGSLEGMAVDAEDHIPLVHIFFSGGTFDHLGDHVHVRHGVAVGVQQGFGKHSPEIGIGPGRVQPPGAEPEGAESGDPAFGYLFLVAEPACVKLGVLFFPLVEGKRLGILLDVRVDVPHIGGLPMRRCAGPACGGGCGGRCVAGRSGRSGGGGRRFFLFHRSRFLGVGGIIRFCRCGFRLFRRWFGNGFLVPCRFGSVRLIFGRLVGCGGWFLRRLFFRGCGFLFKGVCHFRSRLCVLVPGFRLGDLPLFLRLGRFLGQSGFLTAAVGRIMIRSVPPPSRTRSRIHIPRELFFRRGWGTATGEMGAPAPGVARARWSRWRETGWAWGSSVPAAGWAPGMA